MKKTANIWSVTCSKTQDSYSVTRYTDNLLLNLKTGDVCVVIETTKDDYDLTLNNKNYKIVNTIDIHSLGTLVKLFEGRSIKYRKIM